MRHLIAVTREEILNLQKGQPWTIHFGGESVDIVYESLRPQRMPRQVRENGEDLTEEALAIPKFYECPVCGPEKTYTSDSGLAYHLRTKHPDYDKTLTGRPSYRHRKAKPSDHRPHVRHPENKGLGPGHSRHALKCPHCDFKSKNPGGLATHVKHAHGNGKSQERACPYCDFVAKAGAGLWQHKRSRHPEQLKAES